MERIKKAMRPVANGHWMVTDDDLCFRGALAAVFMDPLTTDEDRQRMEFTLTQMRSLGALMSGVPVDVGRVLDNPDEIDRVPLVKFWNEAKIKEPTPPPTKETPT